MQVSATISALLIMSGVLHAEPFAESFDVMGTLSLSVGGTEMTMYIPYDRSRGRPFVTSQKMIYGQSVSITAASPTATGAPGRPMAQLYVMFSEDGTPEQIFVRWSDDQGVSRPLLADANLGESEVTEYQKLDDGQVHIGFAATLLRVDVTQSMTDPLVVEGEPSVSVQGVVDFQPEPPKQ